MSLSSPSVIELRQYTLKTGQRDALIALFEREFVDPQSALGAHVLGTYRDLDDPDRFVWLRGFAGMVARKDALEAFYGGPVWRAHRDEANATMLDSDNVLLLRPIRPAPDAMASALAGWPLISIDIHYLAAVDPQAFAGFFDTAMQPQLRAVGGAPIASLRTEPSVNSFPRLPVRED